MNLLYWYHAEIGRKPREKYRGRGEGSARLQDAGGMVYLFSQPPCKSIYLLREPPCSQQDGLLYVLREADYDTAESEA